MSLSQGQLMQRACFSARAADVPDEAPRRPGGVSVCIVMGLYMTELSYDHADSRYRG